MPATATMSTAIEVSAAAYWSLRLDRDFDLFCAVKDGASFTLHSESEEADAEGLPRSCDLVRGDRDFCSPWHGAVLAFTDACDGPREA